MMPEATYVGPRVARKLRAAAIVIHRDKLLVIHRIKPGGEYFVLPGGGVDHGESTGEAAVRELYEETSIRADHERLVYRHRYIDGSDTFYYLCRYRSGRPALGDFNEMEKMRSGDNSFTPKWVPLDPLPSLLLPRSLRLWLPGALVAGFQGALVHSVSTHERS